MLELSIFTIWCYFICATMATRELCPGGGVWVPAKGPVTLLDLSFCIGLSLTNSRREVQLHKLV